MTVPSWVRAVVPAWVIVLSAAALVGATSAVISVVLYRDVTRGDSALPVPSESE